MLVIGSNLLGNLNARVDTQSALGMPIWRLVVGAGIVSLCLGLINIIAVCVSDPDESRANARQSYVYRDTNQCITARQMRCRGNRGCDKPIKSKGTGSVPSIESAEAGEAVIDESSPIKGSVRKHTNIHIVAGSPKRNSMHPSYYPGSPATFDRSTTNTKGKNRASSIYSRATNCTKAFAYNRFGKINRSPVPPMPLSVKVPPTKYSNVVAVREPAPAYQSRAESDARFF